MTYDFPKLSKIENFGICIMIFFLEVFLNFSKFQKMFKKIMESLLFF